MNLQPQSDHTYIRKLAERLGMSAKHLADMAIALGNARQIRAFESDLRKAALAKAMLPFLKAGESAVAADAYARASAEYTAELERIAKLVSDAEIVIAQWAAEQAAFEASRSLLSLEKTVLGELHG